MRQAKDEIPQTIWPSDVRLGEVMGQMEFLCLAASRCTGGSAARLRTHYRVFALICMVVNRQVNEFSLQYNTTRNMVRGDTEQVGEEFDAELFDRVWLHAASWARDPQARTADPLRWAPDAQLLTALQEGGLT